MLSFKKKTFNTNMVSIITVNYNSLEVTCELLESVRRFGGKGLEVVVVDNASTENPEEHLKNHYPEVIYVRSEKNLGFAGGNKCSATPLMIA